MTSLPLWIVVPTLNERAALPETVNALSCLTDSARLLFVDGGSTDGTREWLAEHGLPVVHSPRGRGSQLAAGAERALAECAAMGSSIAETMDTILWFVHADCRPSLDAVAELQAAVAQGAVAGSCTMRFSGSGWEVRGMTAFYGAMSRLGLSYGDATLFIRADAYRSIGGFAHQPLFEDLDLLRRVRRRYPGGFRRIRAEVLASSRRFEGLRFPLVFTQWVFLQALFWCGVPPRLLAAWYRPSR
ncbi:MAG: glycosyltransferase [Bryobacterales bacterium]|nr:glycosyltransferase [Bryobacterales bacterium]